MEHMELPTSDVTEPPENVQGWTESFIKTITQTSLGQAILKLIDQFFWIIEKSAQWSLPIQEITTEENGKSFGKMELVRPLPWILFLPGLLILRIIRAGLNVGAFVLGYPQIQPSGVVKFVQKSRRHLRAIKLNGMKNIRRKTHSIKDKRSMNEAKKSLIRSIQLTLSSLSCLDSSKSNPSPPPTKIHISSLDLETTPTPEEKSTTESADSLIHVDGKCDYLQGSSDEQNSDESESEQLESKTKRLVLEDSLDDPDFTLADCSTSETGTTTSENTEQEISFNELQHIRQDAMQLYETMSMDLKQLTENAQRDKAQEQSATESSDKQEPVSSMQTLEKSETTRKYSQDADTTYYSPISSKSSSPERWASTAESKSSQQPNSIKTDDVGNGEVNSTTGFAPSGTPPQETTNGVVFQKRSSTTPGKAYLKGKRTNHSNRKKK